jgi:hypothetical protein
VPKEVDKVTLILHVQGENFVSKEIFNFTSMLDVHPKEVNINRVVYHRYGDVDNFVDVKPELVVMRSVKTIYKDRPDKGPSIDGPLPRRVDGVPEPAAALERGEPGGS